MAEHSAPVLEIDPKYGPFDKHTPMMQEGLSIPRRAFFGKPTLVPTPERTTVNP